MMQHHETPIPVQHWEGYELARDDTHAYVWVYMGFNIRLLAISLGPDGAWGYDYAWCYPRDRQAVTAAVAAWDADTQDEPSGWHKRVGGALRHAPRRDEAPDYNQPRCEHGRYAADACTYGDCADPDHVPPQLRAALDVMGRRGPVTELTAPRPSDRPEGPRP